MRYLIVLLVALWLSVPAVAETPVLRIRDVARVNGFNTNPLIGYGVVVGLQGTGDSSAALSTELLSRTLDVLGMNLPTTAQSSLKLKNMAMVMVTASLPAFTEPGDTLPVTVSSMGDATDLSGGVLLLASLRAADGQVYASAQGAVTMPVPAESPAPGSKPHLTVGEVRGGGLAIREAVAHVAQTDNVCWVLNRPDFEQAAQLAASINGEFGSGVAEARDAETVTVHLSKLPAGATVVDTIARMSILALGAVAPHVASVVLDRNSGAVLQGGDVALHTGTLTVNGMVLTTTDSQRVTVSDVVRMLQETGMSSLDQAHALQLLHQANLLPAEVEVR